MTIRSIFTISAVAASGLFSAVAAQPGHNHSGPGQSKYDHPRMGLSYSYPAVFSDWENAFLAGNGKMGIIVFGNPLEETVIFNDRGFNMAAKRDRTFRTVDPAVLTAIRDSCAAGNFAAADKAAAEAPGWKDGGEGDRHPGFCMHISTPEEGTITNYSRTCNYRTGEITVKWTDKRGDWERRAFVSRKDDVTVQYLTAPRSNAARGNAVDGGTAGSDKLTCTLRLSIDPGMHFPAGMRFTNIAATGELNMWVAYPEGTNGAGYEGVVRVVCFGGKQRVQDSTIYISGADSVLLLTRTARYHEDCNSHWNRRAIQARLEAVPASYTPLLRGQVATHEAIYDRVALNLDAADTDRALSNEALLTRQKTDSLPVRALYERIFDAGRYYYLSSSSDETPPDLLGIWTGDCKVGWGGFYHLDANLNLQVSGGNIGDMPEAMEGYFRLNEDWKKDFEVNARKLLGCRGLLACGNSPGPSSGLMASINGYYPYQYATGEEGWLLYPFWEHYLVTGDTAFLRHRLYPLLREMGDFYEDFLKRTDSAGHYIFAGSVSPENQPSNLRVSLLNNADFDIAGARFCLETLLETCKLLGLEQGLGKGCQRWSAILEKLPPYLLNAGGGLQEWSWPGLADHYNHRHSSLLLMVWPFRAVTPETDSSLYRAASVTLSQKDQYNYENAGHGLLHSALIAANLKNAGSVGAKLLRLTREGFYFNSLSSSHYVNHGVFCTDVCNAVPGIMMEMLVASAPGVLELLPALPAGLEKGAVSGIKGRNRVTVRRLSWDLQNGSISCVLRSDVDQSITLILRRGIGAMTTPARVSRSPLGQEARVLRLPAGVSIPVEIKLHAS
jgi:alpha-L-fucosidase 2